MAGKSSCWCIRDGDRKELFYLKVGEADATGYSVDDGFVVTEQSIVRNTILDLLRASIPEVWKQL